MKLEIIRTEIDGDPLVRNYAGMTDKQVANSMNTKDRPDTIPVFKVHRYTQRHALWEEIADTAANGTTESVRRHCIAFRDFLDQFRDEGINLSLNIMDTTMNNILSDLVSDGILTNPQKNSILALGDDSQSRARELGLRKVREGDVINARALP